MREMQNWSTAWNEVAVAVKVRKEWFYVTLIKAEQDKIKQRNLQDRNSGQTLKNDVNREIQLYIYI